MSGPVPVDPLKDAARLNLEDIRSVMDNLSEGMIISDLDGNILLLNQPALKLFGFPEDAPQLRDLHSLSAAFVYQLPDGTRLPREAWPPLAAHKQKAAGQAELLTTCPKTGQSWMGQYNIKPVLDRQGQPVIFITTITDVTQQRRREDQLRFLSLLGGTLIRLTDPNQIFARATSEIGGYLQVERCFILEMVAKGETAYVHPDYFTPGQLSMEGFYPSHAFPVEMTAWLENCEPVVIPDFSIDPSAAGLQPFFERYSIRSLVGIPHLRQGKRPAALIAGCSTRRDWSADDLALLQSASDLAWLSVENARLYHDLTLTEERMRLVAVNTGLVMYTNDLDLRYTWAYLQGLDCLSEELVGKRDSDLLPETEARPLKQVKQRVLDTGVCAHLEMEITVPNGKRLFDMCIEPLRSPEEEVLGLTVVAFDITERRQVEEEARRSANQLETSRLILKEREIERIKIAQDLHDGPLQTVMALSFAMSEALRTNRKAERLDKLQDIRVRLQALAQELRGYSAALRPPALAPFGLEKTIRSHIEGFQSEHPELRIDLELMADGQSLSDEVRLAMFRIYQHLLDNIVRHAHARRVSIHLTLDEAQVELEIQDDGQGFELPPSWLDLARLGHYGLVGIFERIEALDGRVLIRSSPGKGTLVRVIIPRSGQLEEENVDLNTDSKDGSP